MNNLNDLNLRQTIEGMTLAFDAEAAGALTAIIQFNITRSTDAQGRAGDEPGNYYLAIANGACQFHVGLADIPTLIITTPADVWLKISRGELSGQDGLVQGLYQANGNLSLLLNMNNLFKAAGDVVYEAPGDQRPAGPIPLPGMAWLAIAFIPWIIYWVTFDIPSVGAWFNVGLPLLLSILIVGYRQVYDKPTVMEWGGLGFFALAGLIATAASSGRHVCSAYAPNLNTLILHPVWSHLECARARSFNR